ENATGKQRDFHGGKVIRVSNVALGLGLLTLGWFGTIERNKADGAAIAAIGQCEYDGSRFNAGQSTHTVCDLLVEVPLLRAVRILCARHAIFHRQEVPGIKSWRGV